MATTWYIGVLKACIHNYYKEIHFTLFSVPPTFYNSDILLLIKEIDKETSGLSDFHQGTIQPAIDCGTRDTCSFRIHFHFQEEREREREREKKKQHHEEILPHHMNMQGLDTSSVITNVAANYRACHDTVIHEYSSLTDIDSSSMQRPLFPFYCLIVNGEQVPPSCHGGASQLQDKLFHKALLVNSVLYKGV